MKNKFLHIILVFFVFISLKSCGLKNCPEDSECNENEQLIDSIKFDDNNDIIKLEDGTLITYPLVPGLDESKHYRFRVRTLGGKWLKSFAWISECKDKNNNILNDQKYKDSLLGWTNTYTNFVMTDPVEIEISRANNLGIVKAAAHPAHKVDSVNVVNGKVYVVMSKPSQIAVDIDGQMDDQNTGRGAEGYKYQGPPIHTVTVFGNPPIKDEPQLGDPGVYAVEPGVMPPLDGSQYEILYFRPGIHNIDSGFPIYANKSYYIHGSAIVYGTFNSTHEKSTGGKNIRIFGYGTLSGAKIPHPESDTRPKSALVASMDDPNNPVRIFGAQNTICEGITIEDSAHHSLQMFYKYDTENPTIARWVKIFTWRSNGDGIFPGGNMLIEDCFLRTQDDALYVRGAGMRRLVIWNDSNGAAFVLGGVPEHSLVIEDIDVIYSRTRWHIWSGGRIFSLRAMGKPGEIAGGNTIFRNIRVSDPHQNFQTFMIYSKADYPETGHGDNKAGGSGLKGITFQNITTVSPNALNYPEVITGHKDGPISNLTFDNVVIGGKRIDSISDFKYVNEHVSEITFR